MLKNSSPKRVAVYYRIPPETRIDNTQVVNEINDIKDFCRQRHWKPEHTFIDKSISGSMYKTMADYTADPKNNISVVICYTAGNNFAEFGNKDNISISEEPAKNKNAKFSGGGIPYGYIVDSDGALALDTDKAGVILEIFESKAKGYSLQQIIDTLNQRGVKSARGGLWTKPAIAFLIKNKSYTGEYQYHESSEQREVIHKIPKIVSKQLFNKVNGQ